MRVLFVTPRFPYPPLKGDTLRVYHQIRALYELGHEISLLSMADAPVSGEEYARVAQMCTRVEIVRLPRWRAMLNVGVGVASKRPLQVSYYHLAAFQRKLEAVLTEGRFDAVHVTLIRMLPYVWAMRELPIVVDLIDSLGLNLEDRRSGMRGPKRAAYEIEYQRVCEYERAVVRRFPALVVSSEADRQALGGGNVSVIPNGVDVDKFAFYGQESRDEQTLVFTGNMGYGPNEEAVLWFLGEAWPLLRKERLGLRFQVVGTNPSARVQEAAQGASGVEVLGRVADVTDYLGRATVAVCPMRSGSGIQNKVLEAMATGTPVVATSIANRGVGGASGHELLVADSAAEFASSIVRLLDDGELRARLGEAGRAFVEQNYRWEEHARMLAEVYEIRSAECGVEVKRGDAETRRFLIKVRNRFDYSIFHTLKTLIKLRVSASPRLISTPKSKIQNPKSKIQNVMLMTDVTGRGGAEKALVDIALRLDRSKYNVSVCATRSAGNYQPLLEAAGVRTFVQGRRGRWDLRQWVELVRLLRRERVDILHTHLFGSNTLGRLLGRLAGVPVIVAHEHWSTKARKEVWVDRLLYRLSDRILVPSAASKATVMEMEGIPGRYIDVMYNGVDTAEFEVGDKDVVRKDLGIPASAFVVGMVGRLSVEKGGVDHLIHAVSQLRESRPNVQLLIVGDGPLRAGLEEVAAPLSDAVMFTGTRADVARLLGAMDVFVLPSLNEALPIVMLEAMSVGLPVVATRVGGVPEIVNDGRTGLLVPAGDEAALYGALESLIGDDALRERLAKAGQARVRADFTIEKMVGRVEALYENLATRKIKAVGADRCVQVITNYEL